VRIALASRFGTGMVTRATGLHVRDEIAAALRTGQKIEVDFSGIDLVSHGFADEAIAKLLHEFPLADLSTRCQFRGCNAVVATMIRIAVQERKKAIAEFPGEGSRDRAETP